MGHIEVSKLRALVVCSEISKGSPSKETNIAEHTVSESADSFSYPPHKRLRNLAKIVSPTYDLSAHAEGTERRTKYHKQKPRTKNAGASAI